MDPKNNDYIEDQLNKLEAFARAAREKGLYAAQDDLNPQDLVKMQQMLIHHKAGAVADTPPAG